VKAHRALARSIRRATQGVRASGAVPQGHDNLCRVAGVARLLEGEAEREQAIRCGDRRGERQWRWYRVNRQVLGQGDHAFAARSKAEQSETGYDE
jgi:hypothetical protein